MGPILYLRDFSPYSQKCPILPHVAVDLAVEGAMQGGEDTPLRSAGA